MTSTMSHRDSPESTPALGAEKFVFLTATYSVFQDPSLQEFLALFELNLLLLEFGRLTKVKLT